MQLHTKYNMLAWGGPPFAFLVAGALVFGLGLVESWWYFPTMAFAIEAFIIFAAWQLKCPHCQTPVNQLVVRGLRTWATDHCLTCKSRYSEKPDLPKQGFYIDTDASGRVGIWFTGHAWDKDFPNLKKTFKRLLKAKVAYRWTGLDETELSMSYTRGSFCIDVDNWFTIVRPQSNIETVLEDLVDALVRSGDFEQIENRKKIPA